MELADASLSLYLLYVLLVHAAASENDDAAGSKLMQLGEQRCTFERCGLLTRCQDAVDTELNELFECAARIVAAVEGAVERDGHALGSLNQATVGIHVERSVSTQTAYHHTIDAQLPAHAYILQHALHFERRIEEVAAARTYYHVEACRAEHAARNLNLAVRRRGAALGYAGAKFYTVGAAFLRCQTTLYAVGADFKSIFLFHSYFRSGGLRPPQQSITLITL